MNAALQAALGQLFLDLPAAIGAVGPHVAGGVVRVQNIRKLLAVVHGGIAHRIATHELVSAIDTDMDLVAVIGAPMRPGPARVLVLLAVPGGLLVPSRRRLAGFDCLVVIARVALPRRRHNRRIGPRT